MHRLAIPAVVLILLLIGVMALSLFLRVTWIAPSLAWGVELTQGRIVLLQTDKTVTPKPGAAFVLHPYQTDRSELRSGLYVDLWRSRLRWTHASYNRSESGVEIPIDPDTELLELALIESEDAEGNASWQFGHGVDPSAPGVIPLPRHTYTWSARADAIPLAYFLWLLLLIAAWPIAAKIRRICRARANRCVDCNYDLNDVPTSLCPECGRAAP